MDACECVSFLLLKDDTVLLERRALDKASDPGLVAIPGGHVEPGEDLVQALHREMDEELAVVPEKVAYLCSLYHCSSTNELQRIHYYLIPSWRGEIQSLEAAAVEWHAVDAAPIEIDVDRVALGEYVRLCKRGAIALPGL